MKHLHFFIFFLTGIVNAQQTEAISWDDARINDKLELTTSKRDFEKFYKADNITTPEIDPFCELPNDDRTQYLYYKGLCFEIDNGVMNFRHILFEKKDKLFFTHKGIRFDNTTKLSDFIKLFPNAAMNIEDYENMDGVGKLIVLPSSNPVDENEWRFYFKGDKLISIECHFSC